MTSPNQQPTYQSGSSQQLQTSNSSYAQLNGPHSSIQAQSMPGPVSYPSQNAKKRKRLTKACHACHKAKRRCDGAAPCSNCDFAGRTCVYLDSNGNAVPPPPRNNINQQVSTESYSPPQAQPQHQQQQQQQQHYSVDRPRAISNVSLTANSPHLSGPTSPPQFTSSAPWITNERRRALLNVFFSKLHPYSSIIDELSFTRDLASNDVSQILVLSMLALSAPHEETSNEHPYFAGEDYARLARRMLSEEDSNGNTAFDYPDVEVAQALTFLAVHELGLGRNSRSSLYIGGALRITSSLRLQEGIVPISKNSTSQSSSDSIKRASLIRFACLVTMLEVLISILAGQHPITQASDIDVLTSISLPDALTSSFVRLASSVALLAQVVTAEKASRSTGVTSRSHSARSEADGLLRHLQSALPSDQILHPHNRQFAASELSSPNSDSERKMKAWCWVMMHSMNCVSQIILERGSSSSNSANESLIDLLTTLSASDLVIGRMSQFSRIPLLVAGQRSRSPSAIINWSRDSVIHWRANAKDVESGLLVLGFLNHGQSPVQSPIATVRPLVSTINNHNPSSNSAILPPLMKSHPSNGHSRSSSSFTSSPPPALPSLRISHSSSNNLTSPTLGSTNRLPSLSPRPLTSSERGGVDMISSSHSSDLPPLSSSSTESNSSHQSGSHHSNDPTLQLGNRPRSISSTTPNVGQHEFNFKKRPNSNSPPPYKGGNSNGSFGSLLHPSSEKWSPLPPVNVRVVRERESNIRT